MSAVTARTRQREVATFAPERTKVELAKADSMMEFAARVKNWPLLETAVDHKIVEQQEFVRWWKENVRGPGKANYSRSGIIADDAEERTGITAVQVSKWAGRLKEPEKYRNALIEPMRRKAMAERGQTDQKGASGTGENEWYTPSEYIELARTVLGAIDLDPASSDAAQTKVRAAKFFTKDDDGIKQDWIGRVWLNPPYAQPDIANFVSKMCVERRLRHVTGGIMLTHNYTDTAWFHEAASLADAICFTRGRVRFYGPNGEIAAPTQGQAFFYFGDDIAAFAQGFASIGFIATPFTGEV